MDLNIFASIGGGDETFTALTIKGFDNSCHFTRQTNSLMGITRRTIH
ncbi:cold shock-like protein CspF, partial [Salmonella enterica subsp. enterica serovar London str. CFSAN001081]